MSNNSFEFGNPVELVQPLIEPIDKLLQLEHPEEEALLVQLDDIATVAGLDRKYYVQAGRALSIPAYFEADQAQSIIDFNDVIFEAPFTAFSVVRIGKIIGHHSVSALCVSFDEALLLPGLEYIPDDHLLHVPVRAVDSMVRTE